MTKRIPKKILTTDDHIFFDREVDVLNQLFNMGYAGWQKASCHVGKSNSVVWFPKMAVMKNGRYQAPQKGAHDWINVMSEDGSYIRMYTDDNHLTNDNNWDLVHYAFGKNVNKKYHYIGTFIKRKTQNYPYEAGFERIATSIDLEAWDSEIIIPDDEKEAQKVIKGLTHEQLLRAALQHESESPEVVLTSSKTYKRATTIASLAKERANGYCELCGNKAPFISKNGEPFLEVHHIVPLAEGGSDTITNTVALCPNCHRRMHQLNDKNDVIKLLEIHKCQNPI